MLVWQRNSGPRFVSFFVDAESEFDVGVMFDWLVVSFGNMTSRGLFHSQQVHEVTYTISEIQPKFLRADIIIITLVK